MLGLLAHFRTKVVKRRDRYQAEKVSCFVEVHGLLLYSLLEYFNGVMSFPTTREECVYWSSAVRWRSISYFNSILVCKAELYSTNQPKFFFTKLIFYLDCIPYLLFHASFILTSLQSCQQGMPHYEKTCALHKHNFHPFSFLSSVLNVFLLLPNQLYEKHYTITCVGNKTQTSISTFLHFSTSFF